MIDEAKPDYLLLSLEKERAELLVQMDELKGKLAVVDKMIFRHKATVYGMKTNERVNRKNIDRLYVESKVLEILSKSHRQMAPSDIRRELERQGLSINPSTIRSHLFRLAKAGKIDAINGGYRLQEHSPNKHGT